MLRVRELTLDDLGDAWELGRLAFGSSESPPPAALSALPGVTRYGAFDAGGRLVGKAVDLHHQQWWSGRRVAAADVAGVAVLPEARGTGVARALLTELLRGAHERGAAVSALFPTVTAPYRGCGWEVVGSLRTVDLAAAAVARHRPAASMSVRPGTAADLPAVAEFYERVTAHRCGLLTRDGEFFDQFSSTEALPSGVDGLTLVHDGDRLRGYVSWERGEGYDATAVLTVHEALADHPDAARALIGVLGSWHSVAPTLRLVLLGQDAMTAQLPLEAVREHRQQPWMNRPVDVVRAVQTRGWPAHVHGTADFALHDAVAPWNTGAWRLEVADGSARLHRLSDEPALTLSVRGFALLYCGAAQAASVAQAGLLHCAAGASPAGLDLLAAGPPAELLDYF